MRALIFADRESDCLAPLDREYSHAILPLAGKELIRYTIEDLVGFGITEVVIIAADHADRLERLLGDGSRWGARFRFVLARGHERPSLIWSRVRVGRDEPLLLLRGDLLRSPAVADFMRAAQSKAGEIVYGIGADPRGALILLRPGQTDPGSLLDLLDITASRQPPDDEALRLPDLEVRILDSLAAYHRACLDLVAGRISGLAPGGLELALGLSAGLRAQVSPRSLKQGRAYVGENSRVHPEAELLGDVMIAQDVVIDRAAILYDCVIMPHSYVGEMLEVNDAIVAGDTLMRVDTGVVLTISDAFLLGHLGSGSTIDIGDWPNRLLGALLLVCSLPLWFLALLAAALEAERDANGKRPPLLAQERLIGNRRGANPAFAEGEFSSWRIQTQVPVLSRLPRLLAVVRGDLRLVGVSPLTPAETQARTEEWQHVRDQAPAGLIGPTQLMLPEGASLDERLMSDAFYVGQRHWRKDARLLGEGLRALFSAHAWRGLSSAPASGR
jgi:hypothetical protein